MIKYIFALSIILLLGCDQSNSIDNSAAVVIEEEEGWTLLKSGLKYQVIEEGTGEIPKASNTVTVHYEGKLLDGTVFDSSFTRGKPATFGLRQVIAGWTEGVQLMKTGATYNFKIPPALAYGSRGAGSAVPPNATLLFKIKLISFK
jgi:FKBP-type peptidyl-prolyl cis-trans isomerase FklB